MNVSEKTYRQLNPGATVGVIGGGQLGRYFALTARMRGYQVQVLDPDPDAPAMQLASVAVIADYDHEPSLRALGRACDAVTVEFENVPAQSLELLSSMTQLAPGPESIRISQDRLAEKQQASASGLTPVPHAAIASREDISVACSKIEFPAILKTTRLGYDGKGQRECHNEFDVQREFDALGGVVCVLEQKINLKQELSVIVTRSFDGTLAVFPVARNEHVNGVLYTSAVPCGLSDELLALAVNQGKRMAESMHYVGVLAVEFFLDSSDLLYFNEMAPRPHNSGHYTLDATVSCQFEQQLRALCGQPLASTRLLSPVVMVNLLGDLWPHNSAPDFSSLFNQEECKLHLYGKMQARPGRKMGHINCLAQTAGDALNLAVSQHEKLHRQLQQ